MNYLKSFIIAICLTLCCSAAAHAQSIYTEGGLTLAWDANKETDLAGYKLYYGTESGVYGEPVVLEAITQYTLKGLEIGVTYYLVLTAFDTFNNESDYSVEINGIAKDVIRPKIPDGFMEVTVDINRTNPVTPIE